MSRAPFPPDEGPPPGMGPEEGAPSEDELREDVLISRVVDAEASAADWEGLREIAVRDSEIWERLAQAQYADARLREAVSVAESVAEGVELPPTYGASKTSYGSHRGETASPIVRLGRATVRMSGWAAAVVLLVLWWDSKDWNSTESGRGPIPGGTDPAPGFQLVEGTDPDRIYSEYVRRGLEEGRVVQELPRLVMSTKSAGDEGSDVEVVYMRRLLERVVVDNFFRLGFDDRGHPVSVPVTPAQLEGLESF